MKKTTVFHAFTKLFLFVFVIALCLSTASCNSKKESSDDLDLTQLNKGHQQREHARKHRPKPANANPEAVAALKKEIEASKKLLPLQVDYTTTWTDVKYNGKDLVFTYTMNEVYASIDQLRENKEALRSQIKTGLKGQAVVQLCVNASAGLVSIYKGDTSGKTLNVKFTCDELRNF